MTNKQALKVRMNLLEVLLLACREQPEELYNYASRTFEHMKEEANRDEGYGVCLYQLSEEA